MNYYNHYSNKYLTSAVKQLIIANAIVFALQILFIILPLRDNFLIIYFGLYPAAVLKDFWLWQLVTSSFLHSIDGILPLHLIFNMLCLFFFGNEVERYYGKGKFYICYFGAAVFSALVYCIIHYVQNSNTPAIGASGAVMAVIMVAACLSPHSTIYLLFFFPMKFRTVIWIIAISNILMLLDPSSDIAAEAHLAGMGFGYLFFRYGYRFFAFLENLERKMAMEQQKRQYKYEKDVKQEVDRLLDKINQQGLHSLTAKEKDFLKQASKAYQKQS